MPDETRSNVYKLFRATRVSPDTSHRSQAADCILRRRPRIAGRARASRSSGGAASTTCSARRQASASRRTSSTAMRRSSACGSRATASICSASAAAPTRCGASAGCSSIAACRRRSSARNGARSLPLQRDLKIGAAHRHRSGQARLPVRQLDQGRSLSRTSARRARHGSARSISAVTAKISNTAPYFIGVWDTVGDAGRGNARACACWPASTKACALGAAGLLHAGVRMALSGRLPGAWRWAARRHSIWWPACVTGDW